MHGVRNMKYSISLRVLHWLMGVLLLCMICSGFYMSGMEKGATKALIYGVHKQTGLSLIFLFILRVLARFFTYAPPMPEEITKLYAFLTRSVHFLLYIMMCTMPLSGYTMTSASGHHFKFLGHDVPLIISMNKHVSGVAYNIHCYGAWIISAMICLHLSGTAWHFFIDKVNLIKRML